MPLSRTPLALAALFAALTACGSGTPAASPTVDRPSAQDVTVQVRPARASVLPGETVDFTSLVTGTVDPSVTWEVVEKDGGAVSATGTYAAPLVTGDFTVRASSKTSPSAGGSAKVRVGRVAVSVSPSAATVAAGGSLQFTATVRGTKNGAVSWSVREPSGCGNVAASGLYTAPGAPAICHVDATSAADPAAFAEATATVAAAAPAPQPVAVTISPPTAAVDACRSMAFTATVTGGSTGAVTWSVQEGSAGGAITQAGVYTAPPAAGTYHVVATSQEAPAASAVTPVTVAERILGVAVSPGSATVAAGGTAQFTATVTTTCGSAVATKTFDAPR